MADVNTNTATQTQEQGNGTQTNTTANASPYNQCGSRCDPYGGGWATYRN